MARQELQTLPPAEIQARYGRGGRPIRFYDARKLMLLRFHQKPGYVMILWLVAGLALVFWLIVGTFLYA